MHKVPITVFHNITEDAAGRLLGLADGYQSHHELRKILQFDAPFRGLDETLQWVYFLCNHIPHESYSDIEPLSRQVIDAYRSEEVRSLSVGDVVVVGETAYAVAKYGFDRIALHASSVAS